MWPFRKRENPRPKVIDELPSRTGPSAWLLDRPFVVTGSSEPGSTLREIVTAVVISDIQRNGPIARELSRSLGVGRMSSRTSPPHAALEALKCRVTTDASELSALETNIKGLRRGLSP